MRFINLGHHLFFAPISGVLLLVSNLSVAFGDWHGDIKFLSDYIYRGYSKSRGNPVVQAHLDYQSNAGWFSGFGLSQVRFDDQLNAGRADLEITPYLGWSVPLSADWRTELSVTGYFFDEKIFGQEAHYAEFYAALHYQDWLSGRISLAPNAYQRHVDVANYELYYRRDVLDTVQLSGGLGYHQAGELLEEDYFYWNAGVTWFVTSYLALEARYVDVALSQHHHHNQYLSDEFYPRPQENQYLFAVTLGF